MLSYWWYSTVVLSNILPPSYLPFSHEPIQYSVVSMSSQFILSYILPRSCHNIQLFSASSSLILCFPPVKHSAPLLSDITPFSCTIFCSQLVNYCIIKNAFVQCSSVLKTNVLSARLWCPSHGCHRVREITDSGVSSNQRFMESRVSLL